MPRLINRQGETAETWSVWSSDDVTQGAAEIRPKTLIPLKHWIVLKEDLIGLADVGVLLEGNDNPLVLGGDLERIRVIAVRFNAFTDGRGYSIARLLRQRLGYTGELRATGDVGRDQLIDLWRCGFDSFEVDDGLTPQEASLAWSEFSVAYQADVHADALFVTTAR